LQPAACSLKLDSLGVTLTPYSLALRVGGTGLQGDPDCNIQGLLEANSPPCPSKSKMLQTVSISSGAKKRTQGVNQRVYCRVTAWAARRPAELPPERMLRHIEKALCNLTSVTHAAIKGSRRNIGIWQEIENAETYERECVEGTDNEKSACEPSTEPISKA
jgi:hypothetical protein